VAGGKLMRKSFVAAGIVLVSMAAIPLSMRRTTRSTRKDPPPDPVANVVKDFLRSHLDEKFVDPALRATQDGRDKLTGWNRQLKSDLVGAYVPQRWSPDPPRTEVTSADIVIEDIAPLSLEHTAPLNYKAVCSMKVACSKIKFPTRYFSATVTLVQHRGQSYVQDFRVDKVSEWPPWAPQWDAH
jgi:hypothetical protein